MTTVEATISGRPADFPKVSGMVDALAAAHRLPMDVVADMQVALDEVLSNIIRHGNGHRLAREIRVRVTLAPNVLMAEVEDDGPPFDPLTLPPPDLTSPLRERAVGGLGIHFVKHLMNDVRYAFIRDRNRLVLTRHVTREGKPSGSP